MNTSSASDGQQHTPMKPGPLQVSVRATTPDNSAQASINNSPKFPTAFGSCSDSSQGSPQFPRPNLASNMESPKSPLERLDEFLTAEGPQANGEARSTEAAKLSSNTTSSPKAQSYSLLRNMSSPLLDTRPLGHSSPPSPRSTASPPLVGSSLRPVGRQTPRTSSIDSAISSTSLATPSSHKGSPECAPTVSSDVSNLIKTAGSADAVIQHLLRERQQTEARNAQLWTLVEKQRKLVLGLNQDLDRAVKDKERYRKQLKDFRESVPPIPDPTSKPPFPEPQVASRSPAPSDSSADLPIQKHKYMQSRPSVSQESAQTPRSLRMEGTQKKKGDCDPAPTGTQEPENRVKSKRKASGGNHAHKQTSSSDIGIFKPSNGRKDMPPLQTQDLDRPMHTSSRDGLSQLTPASKTGISPTTSFTAKRSQPYSAKSFNGPALTLTESTPPGTDLERMTPPRKAPPAPLDLTQHKKESLSVGEDLPDDPSASEYEDDMEVEELPRTERGRKKTREDDDREREALLKQQQSERSRSQKNKSLKARSSSKKSKSQDKGNTLKSQATAMPPSVKALSPEPTSALASSFLSQPGSLASMLNPTDGQDISSVTERSLTAKPMSPGLPLSPRPSDRPVNAPPPRLPRDTAAQSAASPPLSPTSGFIGLPLSPRAPRHPIPHPPHTPMSIAPSSPMPPTTEVRNESAQASRDTGSPSKKHVGPATTATDTESTTAVASQTSQAPRSRGIFKGFISEDYPGLLIPPNALPSIKVTVVSSRLRPSRHSLVLKGADDEPVFTLGVSARFDQRDLWQVEKAILSLHHLDQQLRQSSQFDVKLPDRSLFSGHAPAKVDARRVGLENYFEAILDTPMDEKAAVALCKYLSTHVSEPAHGDAKGVVHPTSPTLQPSNVQMVKEGYLTKRGKNFGGWKSRFFVLDVPVLRYYDAPGGALLGKITLYRAQIGKQSPPKPSGSGDEGDGQYRHAFLIREPKRRDSNSFVDHVLCAESDAERDAWVNALMGYIDGRGMDSTSRPPLDQNDSCSSKAIPTKKSLKQNANTRGSPDSEEFDSLQTVPYEETRPAQPPHFRIMPDPSPEESPSPTTSGSQPSDRTPSVQSKAISGPQNGAKISDAGAWGNRPLTAPVTAQKEHKKRSLFGFHNKDTSHLGAYHPNGSDLSLSLQQYQEQITNVKAAFGAPLVEAVEYCAPRGVEGVCLPAVVYRCLQYLEAKNAASEEGIFRMSGSNTLIKNLKNRFNAEGDFDLLASGQWYDVHAIASLLKQYLRELPSMILTRELHMQFLSVLDIDKRVESKDDQKKPAAYNLLVHKLPMPNFHLLRALSGYLITVVNNSETNKMDIRNIGIVFSPTLHIPTPVILMFLTEFESIFGNPLEEDANVPVIESAESQALTPEDIRSPRQQMFSSLPTPSYNHTFASNNQAPRQDSSSNGFQMENDTGFTPLQSAYDSTPMSIPYNQTQEPGSMTVPGPEYAVARPRNLVPGGSTKQGRRESSMLLMSIGQGKGSLPTMRAGEGMLLAMFIVWQLQGCPHYASMARSQRIAYISDIGAQGLKPLFIAGACVTTVFLDLSFASERWLRHTGRLAKNLGVIEKVLSALSIIFAVAGTCGLILLSIFDTLRHPRLHDGFLLLFIAGYVISAIFICAEYQRLGVHFRQHRILRFSFWMKLLFVLLELLLAVIFIVCTFNSRQNVGAVFEWVIALIFTFYVLTFFVDLLPAATSAQAHSNQALMHQRQMENGGAAAPGGIIMMQEEPGFASHDDANRLVMNGPKPPAGAAQNF
ncbi:MAG: hypothetical protein Q9217_005033 [Psora testacea]